MSACSSCGADVDLDYPTAVYGTFMGGDPRDFTPDPESATPDEIARHKADCAAAEAGKLAHKVPDCVAHQTDEGTVFVTRSSYGLGVTMYRGCWNCGMPQ